MWALHQGKAQEGGRPDKRIPIGPIMNPKRILFRYELEEMLDDWFYDGFRIWKRFALGMGLPLSGGWAEQPGHIIDIIDAFESVRTEIAAYKPGS